MKNILIFFTFVLLSACGGNNSNSSSSLSITGTFIDDPVQGLNYKCSSGKVGVTNASGEFVCNENDTATFSLGGKSLGTVKVQSEFITPYSFFPDKPDAAINLARLLQSIDTDGDTDNGIISLSDSLTLPATLDFSSATFDDDLPMTLVSAETARRHLHKNITNKGGAIPAGENIPVANAGAAQTVAISITVTLDGRASSDADKDNLSYQWRFISKPNNSNAVLTNASTSTPSYVVDLVGVYVIQLIVQDGKMSSLPDTVTITAETTSTRPDTPPDTTPDTTAPIITITGDNPVSIVQNATYNDAGATANDAIDGVITVISTGAVDSKTVGIYTITYTATDKAGNKATAIRTITVTAPETTPDTTAPIITITGDNPVSIVQNATYNDAGATANDAIDGVITVLSTGTVDSKTVGTYTITYTATDKAGNKATAIRTITVTTPETTPDTTAPDTPTITTSPKVTREESVSVEINGEANTTVFVNTVQKATLDTTGKANISLDTSGDDGSKIFSLTLKDSANNESNALTVTIIKDTTAPNTNADISELQTADATPALDGTFPTGDNDSDTSNYTIVVSINGTEYSAINNQDGTWRLADGSISTLDEGFYDVILIITDEAGNETRTTLINKIEINNSGFLIDSALEGIKYTSGQYSGYTDANGLFKYDNDADVTFYMGEESTGISLGSTRVKTDPHNATRKIITLFDLVGTQDENNQKVLNMGRFLQALDSDNDVSNGITIDSRTKESIALLGLKNRIDFDVAIDTFSNNNDIYSLFNDLAGHFGEHRGLISMEDAKAHLVAVRDNTVATKSIATTTTRGEAKETVVLTGVFQSIGGVVEGLEYRSGNQFGRTNDKGEFRYEEGKKIKFFIYQLELGVTQTKAIITPADLVPATSFNHPKPRNIIRLLQEFDAVNDVGKITIDQAVRDSLEKYRSQIDLNLSDGKANDELGIAKGDDEFGAQFEDFEIGNDILAEILRLRAGN